MGLTEQIADGFDDLQAELDTTATFSASGINIIEGEANEVAEFIMGGVEENVTGVILGKKEDFGTLPEIGDTFDLYGKTCRVVSIGADEANPLLTIAYNLGEV